MFTAGVVIEPRWVKGAYLTADYYNTKITNSISSLGGNVILQSCYPDAAGAVPKYCDFIHRDPITNRITTIHNLNTNVGSDELDGLDVTAGYDFGTAIGRWGVQLVTSYLHTYDRTLADGTVIHGAGTWDLNDGGSGGAYPHLRFNANAELGAGRLRRRRAHLLHRGFQGMRGRRRSDGGGWPMLRPSHKGERDVAAYNTWDLTLGYGFSSGAGRTGFSMGVINLFDSDAAGDLQRVRQHHGHLFVRPGAAAVLCPADASVLKGRCPWPSCSRRSPRSRGSTAGAG